MAVYPALCVSVVDVDIVLAIVDDYSPTAVEEHDGALMIYFASKTERDSAGHAIARELPLVTTSPREVDDQDWARRSQAGLTAVTVGRITVAPPWLLSSVQTAGPGLTVVIAPSMGFGTGHHATTRLCLRALQTLDLLGRSVLDVGTGSGVLAIAARLLGAREATGFDSDPDAIRSARENLEINPSADHVRFEVGNLWTTRAPEAEVVTANLTGALLARSAGRLMDLASPGGTLVVSGVTVDEQSEVLQAFATTCAPNRGATPIWSAEEDGWVGLAVNLGPGLVV